MNRRTRRVLSTFNEISCSTIRECLKSAIRQGKEEVSDDIKTNVVKNFIPRKFAELVDSYSLTKIEQKRIKLLLYERWNIRF